MSGHFFPFVLDKARGVYLVVGDVDPTVAPGVARGSSMYLKVDLATKTATLYLRTGPAATDWTVQGGVPSTLADTTATASGGITLVDEAATNGNAGLDVGDSLRAACESYIDFHFGKSAAQDFNVRLINDADGQLHIQFGSGAATLLVGGTLVATGDGSFNTSDARLKRNIRPLADADCLAVVERTEPVSFERVGRDGRRTGVIAQRQRRVTPELVHEAADARGTLSVNYAGLTPYLAGAIRAQQQTIREQAAAIAVLTARLDALEAHA